MAKKTEKKSATKKTAVTEFKSRKGKLGDICGFSPTSVLRRLGAEGVSCAHARAIFAKLGIKMGAHSIDVQVGFGRNGTRPAAGLSKDEVAELIAMVPDPNAEPKAEKKEKAASKKEKKAVKKAKGAKKPTKKESAPAEEQSAEQSEQQAAA